MFYGFVVAGQWWVPCWVLRRPGGAPMLVCFAACLRRSPQQWSLSGLGGVYAEWPFEWSLMCTLFFCVFGRCRTGAALASAHRRESLCYTSKGSGWACRIVLFQLFIRFIYVVLFGFSFKKKELGLWVLHKYYCNYCNTAYTCPRSGGVGHMASHLQKCIITHNKDDNTI